MNPINEALTLMGVGMGTVFIILLLIILCSRGLIAAINRWFPEREAEQGAVDAAGIPVRTIAAITAAINVASGGKARVVGIRRKE